MSDKFIKLENLAYYDGKIKEYISNNIDTGNGVAIYDDYSHLPTDLTEKTIAYCENDYVDNTDVDNPITYSKGFYFYEVDTSTWKNIKVSSNGSVDFIQNWTSEEVSEYEDVTPIMTSNNSNGYSITSTCNGGNSSDGREYYNNIYKIFDGNDATYGQFGNTVVYGQSIVTHTLTCDVPLTNIAKIEMKCLFVSGGSVIPKIGLFIHNVNDVLPLRTFSNGEIITIDNLNLNISKLNIRIEDLEFLYGHGIYYIKFYKKKELIDYTDNVIIENTELSKLKDFCEYTNYAYLGLTKNDGIYTYDQNTGQRVKVALGVNDSDVLQDKPKEGIDFLNLTEHPTDVEENKVKLYAKDDDLYISRSDGTRNRIGDKGIVVEHLEVRELSNPLTTTPLEYGYFKLSADVDNYRAKDVIPFDKVSDGNMQTNAGVITLKKGKTYHISCGMRMALSANNVAVGLAIVNSADDSILISSGKVPVTHNQNYTGNEIVGILTPQEDINISVKCFCDITKMFSVHGNLAIHEIRTNPVAQYGGFETQVLFEGNANTPQEYYLNDLIDNYNYLLVESISDTTTKQVYVTSLIDVTKIDTAITEQFINSAFVSNTNNYSIQYHFTDKKSFNIDTINKTGYTTPIISRILGVKGQLPSLLNGGSFA